MPRLRTSLLREALSISSYLPLLLRTTRQLRPAINELRWIRDHLAQKHADLTEQQKSRRLRSLSVLRSRAKPLQYILGSQPFGELSIHCKEGVLIPRPETENYTLRLASLISSRSILPPPCDKPFIKILDLCSGTGCIALLLHSLLRSASRASLPLKPDIKLLIEGWDLNAFANQLARWNLEQNTAAGQLTKSAAEEVHFRKGNIFNKGFEAQVLDADIIVCNPPYISEKDFRNGETTKSVRLWEPKTALVPPMLQDESHSWNPSQEQTPTEIMPEDIFYSRLFNLWLKAEIKVMLMEVGGDQQAFRVINMAVKMGVFKKGGVRIEVWRDWIDENSSASSNEQDLVSGCHFELRGHGHMRSIVLFNGRSICNPGHLGGNED